MTDKAQAAAELQQIRDKRTTRLDLATDIPNVRPLRVELFPDAEGDAVVVHIGPYGHRTVLYIEPQAAYDFAQALLDTRLEANRITELRAIIDAPEPANVYPVKFGDHDPADAAAAAAAEQDRDVDAGSCLCHDADVCPDVLTEAQADEFEFPKERADGR